MNVTDLLQGAILGIMNFNNSAMMGRTLTEFEALAYEQAFRTYETIMRVHRESLEKLDESESPAD